MAIKKCERAQLIVISAVTLHPTSSYSVWALGWVPGVGGGTTFSSPSVRASMVLESLSKLAPTEGGK